MIEPVTELLLSEGSGWVTWGGVLKRRHGGVLAILMTALASESESSAGKFGRPCLLLLLQQQRHEQRFSSGPQ